MNDELEENLEKIKLLVENTKAKDTRLKTLEKRIKEKDNEIGELKEENFSLKSKLISFTNKFKKLLKLFSDKMLIKNDREKYHEIANDLYNHDIITHDEMFEIHNDYKYSKSNDLKNIDDDFAL